MKLKNLIENLKTSQLVSSRLTQSDKIYVRGGSIGETVAQLINVESPQVCFVADADRASELATGMRQLGRASVALFDTAEPFTNFKYSSRKSTFDLICKLDYILNNESVFVSLTPEMSVCPLPSRNEFLGRILTLGVGKEYSLGTLASTLVANGYTRVERVEDVAEFSLKGDLLDIFMVGQDCPTRISFWGDEIESIQQLEFSTMNKLADLQSVRILPATLVYLAQDERDQMALRLSKIISAREGDISNFITLARDVELGSNNIDIHFVAMLIDKNYYTLADYLPNAVGVVYREFAYLEHLKNVKEVINKRAQSLFGEDFKFAPVNAFKKQIIFDQIEAQHDQMLIRSENLGSFLTRFDDLVKKTQEYLSWHRQVVYCIKTADALNSVAQILRARNINFAIDDLTAKFTLLTADFDFNIIFNDEDVVIFGANNFAYKRQIKQKSTATPTYLPKKGEYVVHEVHGIGYCEGVESIEALGVTRDYFKIVYEGDSVLYVPCENCTSLSLYMSGGADKVVKLNKIGGKEFAVATRRAMKSIKEMAKELILLYSERAHNTRTPYPKDDYLYAQFEASFNYDETPDQQSAIADIERDMHGTKIMDRLICGDVGFGKTEVAFRAAFRAVLDNRQVAFLAPTTVLSLQHYNSALERFKDFGIKIEMLNRFRTKKEQDKILDDLATGKINIICGTHRLLSKDVKFNNLGLLILDEEQRFGVTAKEAIKKMKTSVDVLTLSATPIPRTLNMALMKIRDISILNTPPVNRKSVKTYVVKYDLNTIVESILREHNRGGQVLIVGNKIEELYTLAGELRQNLTEDIVLDVAHGQMPSGQLEDAVHKLYKRETDVFLSTTIIENGIDLPYANTMIVLQSQILGLAQMYQLRGRVGRSNEQAYCFFTYPSDKSLTREASERLEAIAEHTELGSGIKLAMRDLQIRGAGDLLGSEQSGHITNIGYDMYIRLLERATKELRGQDVPTKREIKLDIAINATIPNEFCIDEVERLKIYNQIFAIDSLQAQKDVLQKLRDVYGAIPSSVLQLTNLAVIKHFGEQTGVKHIIINSHQCSIEYYPEMFDVQKVLDKITDFAGFSIKNTKLPTISVSTTNRSLIDLQADITRWLVNFGKVDVK